jgi:hypothetical protein
MKDKKSVYCSLIFFIGFILLPGLLSAQNITAVAPVEILKHRQEVFNQINALEYPFEDSLWSHGRIYEFEIKSRSGTPYFLDNIALPGSLTYNGKLYEDLILSYNLVMDELIIWTKGDKGNMLQVVLNKYYVEKFTLHYSGVSYNFRLHSEMKPIHDHLKEGFYEVIIDDGLSMFVRHKIELFSDNYNLDNSYKYEKQVYLILDGKVYIINKRRNYLKAFRDHKKSLRKYMIKEKINFGKSESHYLHALCVFSKSLLVK